MGDFHIPLTMSMAVFIFLAQTQNQLPPQCCSGVTGLTLKQQTAGLGIGTLALFYPADSSVLLSVGVANKILIHTNKGLMWAKEQKEIVAWLETGKQTLPN